MSRRWHTKHDFWGVNPQFREPTGRETDGVRGHSALVGIGASAPLASKVFISSFAVIKGGSPCENEPAQDGHAAQDRGDRVTKQNRSPDGTPKCSEIRCDVVDGGDESLVQDMGNGYEDTAREGHRQEKAHHGRSLAETPVIYLAYDSCAVDRLFQGAPDSGTSYLDGRGQGANTVATAFMGRTRVFVAVLPGRRQVSRRRTDPHGQDAEHPSSKKGRDDTSPQSEKPDSRKAENAQLPNVREFASKGDGRPSDRADYRGACSREKRLNAGVRT
jgi:hypothetical protein